MSGRLKRGRPPLRGPGYTRKTTKRLTLYVALAHLRRLIPGPLRMTPPTVKPVFDLRDHQTPRHDQVERARARARKANR